MSLLRQKWFKAILLLLVIISLILYWNKDYIKDWLNWSNVISEIEKNEVTKTTINQLMKSSITVNQTDKVEISNLLTKAKYLKSNRIGHGSTPDGSLTLYYDNIKISCSYYKDGQGQVSPIFELSPSYMDSKSQLLIRSEQLAEFLNNSGYEK